MLRKGRSRRRQWIVGGAVLAALSHRVGAVDSTWVGPAAGIWTTAANWSAGAPSNGTPAGTTYNVFIDGGNAQNSVVTLNTVRTIDNLTISAADQLDFTNSFDLTLVGDTVLSTLSNAGTIRLLSTSSATDLAMNATDNTITGGGTILLQGAARLFSSGGRITNVNNTIEGAGSIGVNVGAVTNQAGGLINANVAAGTLTLDPANVANAFVNDGTLQASGGGILLLTGNGFGAFTFTNNNLIQALNGSEVQLITSASVTGGTFSTTGSGVVRVNASQDVFFTNIANTGSMIGNNFCDFGISGTITNSGTININATINPTDIELQVDTTLTGGGTVTLADLDIAVNNNQAGINGTAGTRLTNVNNTIQGHGTIGQNVIAVTNQAAGLIHANVSGGTLTLDAANVANAFVNNGTLQASNGATLLLTGTGSGDFINNNLIQALNGSEVQLTTTASVIGGTFATAGTGAVRVNASQDIFFTNITNTGKMIGTNNSDFGVSGTITNSGTIDINATVQVTDIELQSNVTLTGGGTVTLADLDPAVNNNQAGINGAGGTHRLTNVNNVIQGHGALGQNLIAVTNQAAGLIHANVAGGTLTLNPANVANAFVNDGVMQASGGGILLMTGIGSGAFSNNNLIQAFSGSEVQLTTSASVTGGTFFTTGTGVVRVNAGEDVFFTGITNTGSMIGDNNSDFGVSGTITNAGTIDINATINPTDIELQVNTTLSGGGTVTLADLDTAVNNNQAGINGVSGTRLTNSTNNIQGHGNIGQNVIAVTNLAAGVIHANVPGGTLTLDPANVPNAFMNSGLLRASNGGTLAFTGTGLGSFDSTAGTVQIDAGGTASFITNVQFTSGNVTNNGTVGVASGTVNVARVNGTGTTNVTGGTLTATGIRQGTLSISNNATAKVAQSGPFPEGNNAAYSRLNTLTIANNAAPLGSRVYSGTLDLSNNDLIIDYTDPGASPAADIEDMIRAGFNGGNWFGKGLTSSDAQQDTNFALAIADNQLLNTAYTSFAGQSVDTTTVLVKFTWLDDIDLDGKVTTGDAITFGNNYSLGDPATRATGDMDYDGKFTTNDAIVFGNNYDTSLPSLPEPGSLGVLGLFALARRPTRISRA